MCQSKCTEGLKLRQQSDTIVYDWGYQMKKPRKKVKGKIIVFGLFILAGFLIFNTTKLWIQIFEKRKEAEKLNQKIAELNHEENYLKTEVEKLKDPEYIARYAREKYLYSREGEFTIRIK